MDGDSDPLSSLAAVSTLVASSEPSADEFQKLIDKDRLASLSPGNPVKMTSPRPKRTPKKRNLETEEVMDPTSLSSPKKKRQCHCKNSRCLKLYCECFANQTFCHDCSCVSCLNTEENKLLVQKQRDSTLERNPSAFKPKINSPNKMTVAAKHTKGCHCIRSSCLKRYCECFQANIYCSENCKCTDCKNFQGSEERRTLMEAAEAQRERQQMSFNAQIARSESLRKTIVSVTAQPVLSNLCEVLLYSALENSEENSHSATDALSAEEPLTEQELQERRILQQFGAFLQRTVEILTKDKQYNSMSSPLQSPQHPPQVPHSPKSTITPKRYSYSNSSPLRDL